MTKKITLVLGLGVISITILTGCLSVQIFSWKSNNQSAGGTDEAANKASQEQTSDTDIKDALKDFIGDISIPSTDPGDILPDTGVDLGGPGDIQSPSGPPATNTPLPEVDRPSISPPANVTKTSIFIESTKDGPNRTRLPSGRGAVAVLNGEWLGKIESVTVGGASFSNATDYTKLPNGSREHWRNGTHAKEFHGETISVKFKDGTTLTDKLDGSGGQLYRDNKLNLK